MSDRERSKGQGGDGAIAAAGRSEVDAFLERARGLGPVAAGGRGRLVFALDATMSRQPTWDAACRLQADMFRAAAEVGSLDVQLVYFRGFECRASRWVADPTTLAELMTRTDCRGGHTQIGKVLGHVRSETGRRPVQALVYVGDCVEEGIDDLAARAGELGLLGVPAFVFQEGRDAPAERAFREIARLTRGAYHPFEQGSAEELKGLLKAVAVFAAGGRIALHDLSRRDRTAGRLLEQMR